MAFFDRHAHPHFTRYQREEVRHLAKTEAPVISKGLSALDAMSSGISPTTHRPDWWEQKRLNMEATERHAAAVRKAEEDRLASFAQPFRLPSEEKLRQANAIIAKAEQTRLYKADTAGNPTPVSAPFAKVSNALSEASASLKSMLKTLEDAAAERKEMLKRLTAGRKDDDDDTGGGGDPTAGATKDTTVRPGTSNITHAPNEQGVYADQARKAKGTVVTKTEHVQLRKNVEPGKVVNVAGVDLTSLFTGMRVNPA